MSAKTVLSKSRELQASSNWAEASAVVRQGLIENRDDSELCGELAYLLCLETKEDEAVSWVEKGLSSERGKEALCMLVRHFHCRKLAGTRLGLKDQAALTNYKKLRTLAEENEIKLGKMPGIKVSACLIVKNEEAHLKACLKSLAGYADEIVVVDTGSSDRTIAIAKSADAKVGSFDWCDDFSAARNHALSLATGDWIIWIDADERIAGGGEATLLSAIVRPHFGGYTIPIINFLSEDEAQDQVQHRPCRLFQKLDGVGFEGRIHEQIAPSIERLGLPIARLEGLTLHHYGYRSAEMHGKGKHERTISMLRREIAENPNDGFHLFNLGNALFTAAEYEEAAEYCGKAVELLPPGVYHAQFCYQLWAFALYYTGKHEQALDACDIADKVGYGGQLIEYVRAFTLRVLERTDEALTSINKCLSMSLGEEETGDRSIGAYKALFLRGQLLASLGKTSEAISDYQQVLATVPSYAPARLAMALELKRCEKTEEAFLEAEKVVDASENGLIAADLAIMCARELGRTHEVCRVREAVWRAEPENEHFCLAWAQSAEEACDWHTASRAYDEFLERFEPSPALLINAGRAFKAVNANQAALECFGKAMEINPHDPNAYFNAGDLLYKCEKFADAAIAYKSGLALDSTNHEAWFTFGNTLFKMGVPDGASIAYEQTLRLHPAHEGAAANLILVRESLHEIAS